MLYPWNIYFGVKGEIRISESDYNASSGLAADECAPYPEL